MPHIRFYGSLFSVLLGLSGCATTSHFESNRDRILVMLTSDLVARHIKDGSAILRSSEVDLSSGISRVTFDCCMVEIAPAGKLLSAAAYREARSQTERMSKELNRRIEGDSSSDDSTRQMARVAVRVLMDPESDFPKIGARARTGSFIGDWVVFTTTDHSLDVQISRPEVLPLVDVVGLARELSDLYDQRALEKPTNSR